MAATDGILNTSVTWADFETKLRDALSTQARLGPNKSVLDIGDGNGFVSCCGLITCDWVGAAADEQLPQSVVLKIPSVVPLRRMNDALPAGQKMFEDAKMAALEYQVNEIHNKEVATYDFLDEFEGRAMPKKLFGEAVGAEEKGSGQICLSYIANSRTMNFYERHSVEQLKQIARALGKIQACSLKREPTSPALQKDFFKRMSQVWSLETFRGMFKGIHAVDSSEKTSELMEKIDELVVKYYGSNVPTSIHKQLGFRPVLVNGDLHAANVLIDKDSGDLLALIDWQCTHLGVGVEDLHRIAMSSLVTKERRAAMPMLVEEMYKSMVENLDGAEAPFTLETLLRVADLVYIQCAFFFASNFIAMITKSEKDSKLSAEEKAARKEVMLDKIIGTLEDAVELDAKNNENNNDNLKLVY